MSSEEISTLTVAKLKALCILNDLPTSGKKSELVERLLESGLSKKEVGLPQPEEERTVEQPAKETPKEESPREEIVLSLEDEDTLTPVVEKSVEKSETSSSMILDAEILDAEFADDEPKVLKTSVKKTVDADHARENPTTLLDMIRKPQVAAVLLAVVILGAGGYYYLDNQLDSFTAEPKATADLGKAVAFGSAVNKSNESFHPAARIYSR